VKVKNEKSPYADLQEVAVMAFERISIDHEKMGGLPGVGAAFSARLVQSGPDVVQTGAR